MTRRGAPERTPDPGRSGWDEGSAPGLRCGRWGRAAQNQRSSHRIAGRRLAERERASRIVLTGHFLGGPADTVGIVCPQSRLETARRSRRSR